MVLTIWIMATILVFLAAVIVIMILVADGRHYVYKDGESGGVKVRCPEDRDQRTVHGGVVICPFCGVKLRPPEKKCKWEAR